MSDAALRDEFRRQATWYLDDAAEKVRAVWERLSEAAIWRRPNEQTLAPANQLLHLTGNMRQWVGSALAGLPDVRERDGEFAARSGPSKDELYAAFAEQLAFAKTRLAAADDLLRPVTVQGHRTTELGVWLHQCEHLSYHAGQLVFFAKQLAGREFDFYADWDLNALAER